MSGQFRTPGQVAYEAYFAHSDGKSLVSGAALPTWYEQDVMIREAWQVAAEAVADAIEADLL